jgi:hypothetical protein
VVEQVELEEVLHVTLVVEVEQELLTGQVIAQ